MGNRPPVISGRGLIDAPPFMVMPGDYDIRRVCLGEKYLAYKLVIDRPVNNIHCKFTCTPEEIHGERGPWNLRYYEIRIGVVEAHEIHHGEPIKGKEELELPPRGRRTPRSMRQDPMGTDAEPRVVARQVARLETGRGPPATTGPQGTHPPALAARRVGDR
jgi:hypothetical protein